MENESKSTVFEETRLFDSFSVGFQRNSVACSVFCGQNYRPQNSKKVMWSIILSSLAIIITYVYIIEYTDTVFIIIYFHPFFVSSFRPFSLGGSVGCRRNCIHRQRFQWPAQHSLPHSDFDASPRTLLVARGDKKQTTSINQSIKDTPIGSRNSIPAVGLRSFPRGRGCRFRCDPIRSVRRSLVGVCSAHGVADLRPI